LRPCVIDSSTAVKWYVPEELSDRAVELLDRAGEMGIRLYAPDLIFPEIGNVLWKKFTRQELGLDSVKEILALIARAFPVHITASSSLLPAALEIAIAFNRSIYDSLYIVLAQAREAVFVTADHRLVNSLRQTPLGQTVRFLGEDLDF